ncbi:hypothetical protein BO70DRAFT_364424 [Aspergillus heteromorphus CBS 117.55]|uniref:Uncharacterized protein n=1 Tax=Aspergillus heteromorphus CBS 117.55 TaxID=1448321 RepID=A0A317VMJ5_9EURO|nr:uncharacterized protein BO70DRAFT_364424 [Aspergillus heteromorphus CBS 117.55]PWY74451.1 hypothetical protein BO70DRAFT_364424 [Aspergillus heteromorphus CBS 117.55]
MFKFMFVCLVIGVHSHLTSPPLNLTSSSTLIGGLVFFGVTALFFYLGFAASTNR